jgi:hypothetical protein
LLESTGSLFLSLSSLGIPLDQIHVLGKHYSTNSEVANALSEIGVHVYSSTASHSLGEFEQAFRADVAGMWASVHAAWRSAPPKLVIILDDGGRCLEEMPASLPEQFRVIAIEQTTSGARRNACGARVIQVATSAAKKVLEPTLIAKATALKVQERYGMSSPDLRLGVVGIGSIGKAIAHRLHGQGHDVFASDLDASQYRSVSYARWCTDANVLLKQVDAVYGCTGSDVFPVPEALASLTGEKVLLSVSSEDVEFRALLRRSESGRWSGGPRDDVFVSVGNMKLRILNGGFPINFDRSPVSVASSSIQLTRGLLMAAVIQAATGSVSNSGSKRSIMLDAVAQRFVVQLWLDQSLTLGENSVEGFSDLGWIARSSEGEPLANPTLTELLSA